jgi:hypothetical protein
LTPRIYYDYLLLGGSGGNTSGIVTSWYYDNPSADSYEINSPEQLSGLSSLVNGTAVPPPSPGPAPIPVQSVRPAANTQESFKGKTIKLTADIAFSGGFISIGGGASDYDFQGTFDDGRRCRDQRL